MTAALLAALPVAGAVPVASAAVPEAVAADGQDAESAELSEGQRALAEARESGQRVEVVGERAERTTVYANPDGSTFTLEESAVPVRVAGPDGGWRAPDAELEVRADGTVAPKAAAVEMAFSGGGAGDPLVTIAEEGRSLSLGWPGELPEPELDGESALYREVLDGVDLRVTASVEGFRHVLVVKTPQAAAGAELERIEYALNAEGLQVVKGAAGNLTAVDEDGKRVFRAPPAQMWDSAGADGDQAEAPSEEAADPAAASSDAADPAAAPTADAVVSGARTSSAFAASAVAETAEVAESTDAGVEPGPGDTVTTMDVEVGEDALTVVPDAGMLSGTDVSAFPLYIDPSVALNESERTLLRSDGYESYGWGNGGDGQGRGVGRCGSWNGYYCGPGYVQRLYFEFSPAKLKGKRVLDATFRVTEPWAFQCDPRWVNLVRTKNISSSTTWASRPARLDLMVDKNVSAGRGSLCDPDSPDKPIEFHDNPAEANENLTPTVRKFAAGKFSRLTLMLRAKNESDTSAWKRFRNDAVLVVDFVGVPAPPTGPGVVSGEVVSCETDAADPAVLSNRKPTFVAVAQTKPGGEKEANLRVRFHVEEKVGGSWSVVTEPVRPSSGYVGDGTKVDPVSPVTLSEGPMYRMRAATLSYYNGGKSSMASKSTVTTKGWCYFKVDSSAPKPPVITVGDPYDACVDGNDCPAVGGPGVKGKFTFSPAAGDEDTVNAYSYKLASSARWSAWLAPNKGKALEREIGPELSGLQVLQVRARDNVGDQRAGRIASVLFNVAESEGATGRWHFDDSAPGSGGSAAADSATTEGTRHAATLHTPGAGAGWSLFGRRGEGDYSLWLNDTANTANQKGYAATSGPVVNTQSSFTVSAWAYLAESTEYRTVVSQTGSDHSGFSLYYSPSLEKWVFRWSWTDSGGSRKFVAHAADVAGVPLRVWTHVAGVYDAEARAIQLYVNGRAQGEPVAVPAGGERQRPDGPMQFGRASYVYGSYSNYWRGRVDEVAVFQYAVQPGEVAKEARLLDSTDTSAAVELMAAWDPAAAGGAGGSTLADTVSGYGRSLALTGGASLDGEAIVLDGVDGAARVAGPLVDDTGSFTVTTLAELDGAELLKKDVGYVGQVLGQRSADGSAWGLWYQLTGKDDVWDEEALEERTVPVGKWHFGRLGGSGTFSSVTSEDTAEFDTPVRLTGLFDAQSGTISLYIGHIQNNDARAFTAVLGSGDFAVGRSFMNGTWKHYLPARITDIRLWAGAMAGSAQIEEQVGD
ncbi:LamG domain-containing protein [Streptomyces sp. NPDC002845]